SIPDMRFEQSYLASIRSLIHEVSTTEAADDLKRKSGFDNEKVDGNPEIWLGRLRIEWWSLLYLTVRDQILSPVIQGAVFAVGGIALGHVRAFIVAR
ncbi:hypothetical protein FA10DRAFT_213621, partial [Acaromyces ingoldii]